MNVCSVCSHPRVGEIDQALAGGVPLRKLAARYGLSSSPLHRHRHRHLPGALVAVHHERATSTLDRVEALLPRVEALLTRAERDRKSGSALAAVREARALLELTARLKGELATQPQTTVNLIASADWIQLRGLVLAALAAHPVAQQDVVEALSVVEL